MACGNMCVCMCGEWRVCVVNGLWACVWCVYVWYMAICFVLSEFQSIGLGQDLITP